MRQRCDSFSGFTQEVAAANKRKQTQTQTNTAVFFCRREPGPRTGQVRSGRPQSFSRISRLTQTTHPRPQPSLPNPPPVVDPLARAGTSGDRRASRGAEALDMNGGCGALPVPGGGSNPPAGAALKHLPVFSFPHWAWGCGSGPSRCSVPMRRAYAACLCGVPVRRGRCVAACTCGFLPKDKKQLGPAEVRLSA